MAEENTGGQGRIPREVARSRKKRSPVWEHFTRFTTADGENKAKCKYCSKELAADSARHGTSTLWSHLETHGPPRPQPREAASEASNRKPGYKEACEDLARMIAFRGYDSSIVEDGCFRSFVSRLDPAFEVPSRRTIVDMCDGLFDEAKRDLRSKLKRAPGRLNIGKREAKTTEGKVSCTACHFIDDKWNLREMIMDASMVVHDHDERGPLLGIPEVLRDRLKRENSLEKVCSFTYSGKSQQIYTTYVDNVLHWIAQGLSDIILNKSAIVDDLLKSKLTRQQREEHLLQLGLPDLWTCNEPWYACYRSLEVDRKVRFSTSEGDGTLRFTAERESEFAQLLRKLTAERKSEFAQLLRKLWGTIYRAVQTISATDRPTSNLCLRELFKVREALESKLEWDSINEANDEDRIFIDPEDVPDVLNKARDTLDRCIQESYLVWSIPLVLDPRYKLSYIESNFNNAFESGAAAYIKEVKTQIKKIFSDYNQADKQTSSGDSNCLTNKSVYSTYSLERLFSEQDEMGIEPKSELDRYLEEVRVLETGDFNILKWWKDNSSTYPTVARMAMDALAMTTCSKLSSELMSNIRSMVRGYSEQPFGAELEEEEEEEEEE